MAMSRTEYYYGATRGQITLRSLLLHKSVSHTITCHVKGRTWNMKMTQLSGSFILYFTISKMGKRCYFLGSISKIALSCCSFIEIPQFRSKQVFWTEAKQIQHRNWRGTKTTYLYEPLNRECQYIICHIKIMLHMAELFSTVFQAALATYYFSKASDRTKSSSLL